MYSTEDVADLLGLHVRTVRSYVRAGKLNAVRIGKQYRIAHDDLVEFTGGDLQANPPTGLQVEVTAIVDLDSIDADTFARLSAMLGGATALGGTGHRDLSVESIHHAERNSAKVILVGTSDDVARILSLVSGFALAS